VREQHQHTPLIVAFIVLIASGNGVRHPATPLIHIPVVQPVQNSIDLRQRTVGKGFAAA
jgi:hypothetical protein